MGSPTRIGWGTRALAAALGLLAALVFATSAAALPGRFWGVDPQGVLEPAVYQRLKRGGVDTVRIPISWGTVQPSSGAAFDWSPADRVVGQAAEAGLHVLPVLSGPPEWAVPYGSVPGTGGHSQAPSRLPVSGAAGAGWSDFVTAAVARYGPLGTFWADNPLVPRIPVRSWQVGNEPNFKYFVTRPNPAEYGKLVKISSAAIKSGDPGGQVVLAGLFARPKEGAGRWKKVHPRRAYFAKEFLQIMYRKTPGVRGAFNAVAIHPYSYFYWELTPEMEEIRALLKKNHDAGKGIWITELGWSSSHPTRNDLFAKGPRGQAKQLKGAFSLLRKNQRKWNIQSVYWFSVDDQPGACNFCDGSGLFGAGFVPKPAWRAYTRFAGGRP
jgi:hypothetical protein